MRSRGHRWNNDNDALEAWKQGQTGYPIVDAGMRQLHCEGFMDNRARLITAPFLVRNLRIDWRYGARHFFGWLVDGDVANNVGNCQRVAGTGANPRPGRAFNPVRQAYRFDPDGAYVRRYIPELAAIGEPAVHEPWKLRAVPKEYPTPIVDPT
jgi:deoxyribodipyrimidine photo-lyase